MADSELINKLNHYSKLKTCLCGKDPQKVTSRAKSGATWSSVVCDCGLHTHNYFGEVRAIIAWNEGEIIKS